MTTTSILIISAIASAFLTFGCVLACCDFYSRTGREQAITPERNTSTVVAAMEHRKAA